MVNKKSDVSREEKGVGPHRNRHKYLSIGQRPQPMLERKGIKVSKLMIFYKNFQNCSTSQLILCLHSHEHTFLKEKL